MAEERFIDILRHAQRQLIARRRTTVQAIAADQFEGNIKLVVEVGDALEEIEELINEELETENAVGQQK